MSDELVMFTMWAHMTAELMKRNARDAAGSSCGQKTTQGACVSSRAVQDRGRRLNQSHFRSMAEVSFLPSANTRKRASASREEEGQRIISILILTRYRAYQDAFQARKNMQLLPVAQELEKAIL